MKLAIHYYVFEIFHIFNLTKHIKRGSSTNMILLKNNLLVVPVTQRTKLNRLIYIEIEYSNLIVTIQFAITTLDNKLC